LIFDLKARIFDQATAEMIVQLIRRWWYYGRNPSRTIRGRRWRVDWNETEGGEEISVGLGVWATKLRREGKKPSHSKGCRGWNAWQSATSWVKYATTRAAWSY